MSIYYRLIDQIHRGTPLGYGVWGGRWNRKGIPCIYLSSHTSLCFLEFLSIKGPIVIEKKWLLLSLEIFIPDHALAIESLPPNWQERPYPTSTSNLGSSWLLTKASLSLKVPSIRIPLANYPNEHNLLLNPLHPEFKSQVKLLNQEEVDFRINA